jgi:hypothetical protein
MPKNVNYAFAPSDYAVSTAPQSAALPTGLATSPTALNLPTGWFDIGYLSDAGVGESHNYNETKIFDMAGALLRVLRNQEERPWTFECVENDAIVHGLMYPGSVVNTTGATAEVQTITITGSPTGGTFTPNLAGFPAVPAQDHDVATADLEAALQAAWGIDVAVSGTAGSSYVVTFPTAAGNVPQMTVAADLTGGTDPAASVATTTPGVTGVNSRVVGRGLARNLRYFCIDLFDGSLTERYLITQGEAVWTGSVTYSGTALKIAQFTLNTFFDNATGGYYTKLDNSPASAITFN